MTSRARACAVATVVAACLGFVAPPAAAHALLTSSTPAAGANVATAPTQIRLVFTEPPDPSLSVVHVIDSSGRFVEKGKAALDGPTGLRVAVGSLATAAYTVSWRVVSRADGHLTAGSFSFGVGVAPPAPAGTGAPVVTTPSPSAMSGAGRWALTTGLILLFGGALGTLFVFRRTLALSRWALPGAWALAWTGYGLAVAAERSTAGTSLGGLLSSGRGELLVREGVAVAVAGAVAVVASLRRSRAWIVALAAASAAAIAFHVMTGHAGAPASQRWFKLAVQWLHVLGVGAWVGGLVWVLAGTRATAGAERAGAVRRFSRLAAGSLAVVAATGVMRALDQVGSWHGLFSTGFGQAVVAKSALFLPLVGLGAFNRYRNVPAIDETKRVTSLRRAVGAEVLIATGILGVTSVLTQLAPSASIAAAGRRTAAPARVVVDGADFATTMRVRLTITPGTTGTNSFDVRVVDYDTREAITASAVSLRFAIPSRPEIGESTLALTQSSPGRWTASSPSLAIQAPYRVTVVVTTASRTVEVPLDVTPTPPPRQLVVTPGNPTLYTLTIPGIGSLQAYADPATPGVNQIHATFFDAAGGELSVAQADLTVVRDSTPASVTIRRLGPGHFVGEATLSAGTWRVTVTASTKDGRTIDEYIDVDIKS